MPPCSQVGELLVPGVADGAVHVAEMRLVGPGDHAAREGRRRRDHGVVAGDVELLDQERAEEEQRAVVAAGSAAAGWRATCGTRRREILRPSRSSGRKSNSVKTSAFGNCRQSRASTRSPPRNVGHQSWTIATRAPAAAEKDAGSAAARSRRAAAARFRAPEGLHVATGCLLRSLVEDADARQAPNVRRPPRRTKLAVGVVGTRAGLGPSPVGGDGYLERGGSRRRHPRSAGCLPGKAAP